MLRAVRHYFQLRDESTKNSVVVEDYDQLPPDVCQRGSQRSLTFNVHRAADANLEKASDELGLTICHRHKQVI